MTTPEGIAHCIKRFIVKMCKRCGGTGVIARRGKPINYTPCPRCSGKGGRLR